MKPKILEPLDYVRARVCEGAPFRSREEERAVFVRVAAGDREARDEAIRRNARMAWSATRWYRGRGLPDEDLVSCASIALVRAVDTFRPELGFRFSTHAIRIVWRELERCVAADGRTVRLPPSAMKRRRELQRSGEDPESERDRALMRETRSLFSDEDDRIFAEQIADPAAGPSDIAAEADSLAHLERLVEILPRRLRTIVRARADGRAYESIAHGLGVTRERARQLHQQARRRIRHVLALRELAAQARGERPIPVVLQRVADLAASGLSPKEIARELGIPGGWRVAMRAISAARVAVSWRQGRDLGQRTLRIRTVRGRSPV